MNTDTRDLLISAGKLAHYCTASVREEVLQRADDLGLRLSARELADTLHLVRVSVRPA